MKVEILDNNGYKVTAWFNGVFYEVIKEGNKPLKYYRDNKPMCRVTARITAMIRAGQNTVK